MLLLFPSIRTVHSFVGVSSYIAILLRILMRYIKLPGVEILDLDFCFRASRILRLFSAVHFQIVLS